MHLADSDGSVNEHGVSRHLPFGQGRVDFKALLPELRQAGEWWTVDLSGCDYLDSTFLGCLVEMQRRAGKAAPGRFVVSAPPEKLYSTEWVPDGVTWNTVPVPY